MSVLITGATGYIGCHVLEQLLRTGEGVHVLSRKVPVDPDNPASRLIAEGDAKMFRGDVLDSYSVQRAMKGCDRVFHIAAFAQNWARDRTMFNTVNVGGVLNVLRAAQSLGVRRVVVTSSVVTCGPSNGLPVDTSTARSVPPLTDYEQSKLDLEKAVRDWSNHGPEVVIVNPTRVFGPGLLSEGNSVTRMVKQYIEGTWRLVLSTGNAVGNYAYVRDVAAGHMLAMERGRPGERYILGGENLSFNQFFHIVANLSGFHRRLVHVPARAAIAFGAIEEARGRLAHHHPLITPGWVRTFLLDWAASSAKAQRELGYTITPFPAAIRETLNWLSAQRPLTMEKAEVR